MMMNPLFKRISEQLERLRDTSNIRTLPEARFHGNHVCDAGRRLLNLCSNDYLGLKADPKFMGAFVGTFGKAFASVGAFLIADRWVCDWLVNTMRTLIFTTALPSINLRWTDHVLSQLARFDARRERVAAHGHSVAEAIRATGQTCLSASHIVPWVLGASDAAVACSQRLAVAGYYARPIRPPTVPEGTSRIRFSLTAGMDEEKIAGLCREIRLGEAD